jgi:hypothetical protein
VSPQPKPLLQRTGSSTPRQVAPAKDIVLDAAAEKLQLVSLESQLEPPKPPPRDAQASPEGRRRVGDPPQQFQWDTGRCGLVEETLAREEAKGHLPAGEHVE